MSEALRVHIGYVEGDAQAYRELHRRVKSLEELQLITVTHSAESPNMAAELESGAVTEADLVLLLLSPEMVWGAGAEMAARLRTLFGETGRPRLVPILWRSGSEDQELGSRVPLPSSGKPIALSDDDGLAWARLTKELTALVYEVAALPRQKRIEPSPSETNTRAAAGSLPVQTASVAPLSGLPKNKWALLVGINRYIDGAHFPRLNYCGSDVKTLNETLTSQGYQVRLLHDEQDDPQLLPLRRNVLGQLDDICGRAQPEDLLFVHFACHGFVQSGQQLLAMMDTRQSSAEATALPLPSVSERLRKSAARRRVLVLDACHAGAVVYRGADDDEFIRQTFERAEGFVRIAASTSAQLAQEWHAQKMGAFTYFLNQALLGAPRARNQYGLVTAQTVANYVLFELRKWTRDNLGLEQEPTISYEGLGELVLADYRDAPQKESA